MCTCKPYDTDHATPSTLLHPRFGRSSREHCSIAIGRQKFDDLLALQYPACVVHILELLIALQSQ